ncbi:MAG: hypothetical protein GAK28_03105 [Luteibacter sp.]|uniref:hypothetical protein n=1 Tax=Luteibacter sp. TaxID=1886636 RepID=UPI00137EF540|nr:hypothetical protein [Luteibacter sp.]KAF1005623.1 MAG: hypothetical protein GAK28_03105 [Luteibacter sp.]
MSIIINLNFHLHDQDGNHPVEIHGSTRGRPHDTPTSFEDKFADAHPLNDGFRSKYFICGAHGDAKTTINGYPIDGPKSITFSAGADSNNDRRNHLEMIIIVGSDYPGYRCEITYTVERLTDYLPTIEADRGANPGHEMEFRPNQTVLHFPRPQDNPLGTKSFRIFPRGNRITISQINLIPVYEPHSTHHA